MLKQWRFISLHVVFENYVQTVEAWKSACKSAYNVPEFVALLITIGETTCDYPELQLSRKLKHGPRYYNCFLSSVQASMSIYWCLDGVA